eukprot:gene62221-85093_t
MNTAAQKILVIGGGFSGMAAAIEGARRGLQVDLVELDKDWRSYGAGISLGGPTLRALKSLGLIEAFLQQGAGSDGVELCTPTGQIVGELPTP